MPQDYTRQRQGRDFSLQDALTKKLEENRRNDEIAIQGEEERKKLRIKIQQYREQAERNALPIDGEEPPEKRGITK